MRGWCLCWATATPASGHCRRPPHSGVRTPPAPRLPTTHTHARTPPTCAAADLKHLRTANAQQSSALASLRAGGSSGQGGRASAFTEPGGSGQGGEEAPPSPPLGRAMVRAVRGGMPAPGAPDWTEGGESAAGGAGGRSTPDEDLLLL